MVFAEDSQPTFMHSLTHSALLHYECATDASQPTLMGMHTDVGGGKCSGREPVVFLLINQQFGWHERCKLPATASGAIQRN